MPTDYEPIIRKLKPSVRWSDCNGSKCRLKNITSRIGKITVPANYDDPSQGHFSFHFHQYKVATTQKPQIHLILNCGGPGYPGSELNKQAHYILTNLSQIPIAVYVVDHRGVGESGEFVPAGAKWLDFRDNLDTIVAKGPFPLTQLTIKNGALDVIALAIAIQNESDYDSQSTWHASGASYGGFLVNMITGLAPNFFHSVMIGSSAAYRGGPHASSAGVALSCANDDYCREKIGGNVLNEFRKAVRALINFQTNSCTQAFADEIYAFKEVSDRKRLLTLSRLFDELVKDSKDLTNDGKTFAAQLLLLGLKATSDCLHPESYKEEVLKPMLKYSDSFFLNDKEASKSIEKAKGGKDAPINAFMNTILFIDHVYYKGKPKWLIPPNLDELADDLGVYVLYPKRYKLLQKYLTNYKFSENYPLQTTKTQVFIETGLEDLFTTYPEMSWNYKQIKAPFKSFTVFYARGHTHRSDMCFLYRLTTFLGIGDEYFKEKAESCVKSTNKEDARDWKLKGNPALAKIWDHIQTAPGTESLEKQLGELTHYRSEGTWKPQPRWAQAHIKSPRKPNITKIIAITVGVLLVAALVIYWIFRYRRRSDTQSELTIAAA